MTRVRVREEEGFTMVELAVVVVIMAIMLPAVFLLLHTIEAEQRRALSTVESSRAMRTVSEELRLDLQTRSWVDGETLALRGPGPCGEVGYALEGGVLLRRQDASCGGTRALARHVETVARHPWGLEVVFASNVGISQPVRTTFRMGFP